MKHPALPSDICTKDHRLGWVEGGRWSEGPILPFHLAPDQPQPQLDIFNLCGFHGAFLPSSVLIFVFQSMPFTVSHTVKVISLPFPRHSHPDLDIPHHPLPSSRNSFILDLCPGRGAEPPAAKPWRPWPRVKEMGRALATELM